MMIHLTSYPIARAFTSIAIAFALLAAPWTLAAGDGALRFTGMDGKPFALEDFKGKPVLINLWATWCAPCASEMPSLAALAEKYKGKGLVVLALSEDESERAAPTFYQSRAITALAPFFDKNHVIFNALHARGVPTSILVSSEGNEEKRIEGPVNWQSPEVEKYVIQLIEKK